MGVVFAFSMISQESANGTVFLGEACWTGLFPESGRGADENLVELSPLFAGRADYYIVIMLVRVWKIYALR